MTLSPALVSALSLVTAEVAPEVMAGRHPIVRGALVGDHALVFGLIAQPGPLPGGGWGRPALTRLELDRSSGWWPNTAILRAALSGGQPELIDLGGGSFWPTRRGPAPRRWHLAGGVLYYAACRADEFTLSGQKQPTVGRLEGPNGGILGVSLSAPVLAAGRVDPEGEGRDRLTARSAVFKEVKAYEGLVSLRPVEARFGTALLDPTPRRPEPELWRTHYDFHPVGPPDRCDLYVSAPDGLVRHYQAPRPDGSGVLVRGLVSAHPPAWVGPFYVCADGADRHFVVPGGRVFTLPADAQPGSALVKTWDADPILALIHDADAGKSYAFTKSHYFHVTVLC